MKPTHIAILVLIAVVIAIVVSTYGDASTFVDFEKAGKNPDKEYYVKATLLKDKPVEYDAVTDPEKFTFYALDSKGNERKVICMQQKPFDFERSEEIVVIGKTRGQEEFIASSIQVKCPSKYESEVEDI